MAAKKVNVRCPACDALVNLDTGFWHKLTKQKCPRCRTGISLKEKGLQAVRCPSCGNDVMYNALKGDKCPCPVCGKSLLNSHEREVICPKCGIVNRVPDGAEEIRCMICDAEIRVEAQQARAEASESDRAYVIKGPEDPAEIIWKHPLDAFPYRSRLIVSEGMWALCLQNGECCYPFGPGSYPLNESPLTGEQKFDAAVSGEETVFSTEVYFVRKRIPHSFPWGTPTAIRVHDGESEGEVRMSGRLNVTVSDPKAFAELVGYRSQSLEALTRTMSDAPDSESPLVTLLRQSVCKAVGDALQPMIDDHGWKLTSLPGRTGDIAQGARTHLDMELDVRGLRVDQLDVQNLRCDETEASKAAREQVEARKKAREALLHQVERWINWTVGPIGIHMKGDSTLSADITLGGSAGLRLIDAERLLSRPAAQQWLSSGAPEAEVERHFTALIDREVFNALVDLLQPMIDETGADVRELGRYFNYLRSNMSDYLNQALFDWGLRVESFSLQQRKLEKSEALSKLTQFASYKSESLIEKEMQAFTRSLELENASADSEHRVQLRSIDSSERTAMTNLKINDARTADQADDVAADLEIKRLSREDRLRRYRQDLENAAEDDADARRLQKDLRGLDSAAEIDARKRQIGADARRGDFDNSYAEWQRQTRLDEEKLKSDIHLQEIRQGAEIDSERRAAEARRAAQRDDVEQKRLMSDIVRKIEESDLDWKQKLDAYERLKRNAQADDDEARQVSSARARADADYVREHLKVTLSREESDFLEEQAQRADAREERRQQLEHAREMESRQAEIAHEMELLRIEHEQQEKAEEARQRLRDQEMEIEKLKLMVDHYERMASLQSRDAVEDRAAGDRRTAADQQHELDKLKLTLNHEEAMGRQNVDAVEILSSADALRAKVEREYAERYAQRNQEAEEKRRAEKAQREDQYADRAEALLKQMWDIQKSLKSLELENDREYIRGRADVDSAEVARRRTDLDALIQEVQKLARKVDEVQEKKDDSSSLSSLLESLKAPAQPVQPTYAPVQPTYTQPEFTPGGQTLKCPHCGHPVYKHTVNCPYCNRPVNG